MATATTRRARAKKTSGSDTTSRVYDFVQQEIRHFQDGLRAATAALAGGAAKATAAGKKATAASKKAAKTAVRSGRTAIRTRAAKK